MNKLIEIARTVPNKGRTHIFLGNPLSDGCDKTTVEPGNNFSPGVWTCGISVWVENEGEFYSPDIIADNEIKWSFGSEAGYPPVIEAEYFTGSGMKLINRLTHLGSEGAEGVDFCRVNLEAVCDIKANLYIVVRDIGPAGGKIKSLEWDETKSELLINQCKRLVISRKPSKCSILNANEEFDSPMAVIKYTLELKKDEVDQIEFKTIHSFKDRIFGENIQPLGLYSELSVDKAFEMSLNEWQKAVPVKIFAPDKRIEKVWERSVFHILSAMECGLPRIGVINYPVFWLRDGVIILRSLDLIGRHDLAAIGNDYLSSLYFGGGFGAESDAPGEGIWALVSHAKITNNKEWLAKIFPNLEKRVEYIEKMLEADRPIRIPCESRIPSFINTTGVNLLCLPSVNGTIHGRMDWHSPDFFINCWSEGGLKFAAEAAQMIGKEDLTSKWSNMSKKLERAVFDVLLPSYENDRDSIIAPYPSGAMNSYRDALKEKFKEWYLKNRLTKEGKRNPDNLWTYFEAAQIHNAILLGLKDLAWINLDGMLEATGKWDVSSYIEGEVNGDECLPFCNGDDRRGWLGSAALGGNMPHNWTSAEMVNLIRTIFVVEEDEQLVLGKGVPKEWLKPGSSFGVKDLPTDYGIISYTVNVLDNGEIEMEYKGPENYRREF